MPRTDTIADVLNCDATYIPEVVSGVVTAVAEVRSGKMTSPPYKDYSVQRVTIGDQEGNRIDVHIWDREPLDPSMVGQTLHVMSGVGSKGQRIGLKLEDRAYTGSDGNNYNDRRIKLYPTGQLSIGTYGLNAAGQAVPGRAPGSGAPPMRQNPPRQAGPPQAGQHGGHVGTPRSAPPRSGAPASGASFQNVRVMAAKFAVMNELSWMAALAVSNVIGKRCGYVLGDQALTDVAARIFISLDKCGMGVACPTKLPDENQNQAPSAPPPSRAPAPPPPQQQMANADVDPTVDGANPDDGLPPADGVDDEIPW